MLSQLGFRFDLNRTPNLQFFVTATNLPGLSGSTAVQPTPFTKVHRAYDKLQFNPLTVTFKVDEELRNYEEIMSWMIGIGFPKNFAQRASLQDAAGIYSDGTLTVLNSNHNPIFQLEFSGLIPVSLSDLRFNTSDADVQYIEADVTFEYTYYSVKRLPSGYVPYAPDVPPPDDSYGEA